MKFYKKININSVKKILLVFTIFLLTVGCGKDNDEPQRPTVNNKAFPFIKVGNEWVYEYSDNNKDTTYTYKVNILSEKDGYFTVQQGNSNSYWYVINNYWKENSDIPANPIKEGNIFLYGNSYVGQKWSSECKTVTILVDDEVKTVKINWKSKVLSITDTVTVPAGTFIDCIKIYTYPVFSDSTINVASDNFHWYHKDVGLVMYDWMEGKITRKLISKIFNK